MNVVEFSWCGTKVDVIMVDVWVLVVLTMVGGNVVVVERVEIRVGTSVDVGLVVVGNVDVDMLVDIRVGTSVDVG